MSVFFNDKRDGPCISIYPHDQNLLMRPSFVLHNRLELLFLIESGDPIKRDSAALLEFSIFLFAPFDHTNQYHI